MASDEESIAMLSSELTLDDQDSTLGNVCAGCVELTERVERLELLLQHIQPRIDATTLTARRCYWIILSVHIFVLFVCFSTEALMMIAYPLLLGSAITWSICHVLVVRPFWQKLLRSSFSSCAVLLAAMLGLEFSDNGDFLDVLPMVLMIVPLSLASGWFAASIYVWTTGWRVSKADDSSSRQPLRIRDLLVLTFVVAAYAGFVRMFFTNDLEEIWEWFAMSAYAMLPVFIGTLVTVPIARRIFDQSRAVGFRPIAIIVASTTVLAVSSYFALLAFSGEDLDMKSAVMVGVLGAVAVAIVFSSPIPTFLLMRSAQYRLIKPQRVIGPEG